VRDIRRRWRGGARWTEPSAKSARRFYTELLVEHWRVVNIVFFGRDAMPGDLPATIDGLVDEVAAFLAGGASRGQSRSRPSTGLRTSLPGASSSMTTSLRELLAQTLATIAPLHAMDRPR